jgi:hypothetical protein
VPNISSRSLRGRQLHEFGAAVEGIGAAGGAKSTREAAAEKRKEARG